VAGETVKKALIVRSRTKRLLGNARGRRGSAIAGGSGGQLGTTSHNVRLVQKRRYHPPCNAGR